MFANILVPLDQSELAEHALGMAVAIAKPCGAAIHLVMAQEPFGTSGYHESSWAVAPMHQSGDGVYLARLAGEIAARSGVAVSVSLVAGAPAAAIRERAADVEADLIVMTSHGRTGFSRAWMGSVADAAVRNSRVPVLVLRPGGGVRWHTEDRPLARRVLVPLDGSPEAMAILTPAVALARCSGASIVLARVVHPVPASVQDVAATGLYPLAVADPEATQAVVDEANRQLEEVARRVRDDGVSDVSVDVVVSDATAKSILNIANARRADAIAMASHGRGASRLLIGSVADKVLRGSQRPLLLYRPSGVAASLARVGTLVEQEVV